MFARKIAGLRNFPYGEEGCFVEVQSAEGGYLVHRLHWVSCEKGVNQTRKGEHLGNSRHFNNRRAAWML
jgi:hypothetical protein